ncbi:50S ribosomal protein L31 [Candidatus Phytoplasma oryzae]|nr:50S ribosomal protein L31 [Candidatus Phytoplasma oryzae]
MIKKKQPQINKIEVICETCKEKHIIGTTVSKMKIDTCSNCNSIYNKSKDFVIVAGQVDKFNKRYNLKKDKK